MATAAAQAFSNIAFFNEHCATAISITARLVLDLCKRKPKTPADELLGIVRLVQVESDL
jgi:hypothetical protein